MLGRHFLRATALGAIAGAGLIGAAQASSPQIINLTQVGCQFIESENKTGAKRLTAAKVLELTPGAYKFRVVNKNVPYELGFWLRSKGYDWRNPLHKLTKTSVSGGGLIQGMTKDYEVTLKPGEYVYSCPLNTTPNYRLVVK
jgi:hypothetical protein